MQAKNIQGFKMMLASKKIFVAGHNGMVGTALCSKLRQEGCELITAARQELDLRDKNAVLQFLGMHNPDMVVVAAAKVGGILANSSQPVEFLLENLEIQNSVISGSFETGVRKLCFLGSSCIYPKHASQPISESALMSGPLEKTNQSYAIAKIAGLQLCSALREQHNLEYYSLMPCNLYGRGDNYDPKYSHVIPALLRKFFFAKKNNLSEVVVWGSGSPLREFLHVDDCASAIVHLLKKQVSDDVINLGSGKDISILELATLISDLLGFSGRIIFDENYPDGTPKKLLDNSIITTYGWRPSFSLRQGLASVLQTLEQDIRKSDLRMQRQT